MIGARRQVELAHRCPHQTLTFGLEIAKLPYLPDTHVGVAEDIGIGRLGIGKSVMLNISCGLDAFANRLAGFAEPISAEFFIVYTWDFNVNVYVVKDGTGDAFLVFGNDSRGTSAGFLRAPEMATRAGINDGNTD